jgi:hypothetical protein
MAVDVLKLQCKSAKTPEEAMQKPYQFWSTQPVPKMGKITFCLFYNTNKISLLKIVQVYIFLKYTLINKFLFL